MISHILRLSEEESLILQFSNALIFSRRDSHQPRSLQKLVIALLKKNAHIEYIRVVIIWFMPRRSQMPQSSK